MSFDFISHSSVFNFTNFNMWLNQAVENCQDFSFIYYTQLIYESLNLKTFFPLGIVISFYKLI